MRQEGGPPRLTERILEALLPPDERDAILGDLEEVYRERAPGVRARIWYRVQALLVGTAFALRRLIRGHHWREGRKMGDLGRGMFAEIAVTLRGLARRPGYTVLAVTTIVLGVGAVTAGYGLLHQVVLRPLPFAEADRLVAVRTHYDSDLLGVTLPEYHEVAEHADAFESLSALVEPHLDEDWIWTRDAERRPLDAVRVTDGFFETLGVAPELGSLAGGSTPGKRRIAVSRAFWQRELGGARSVVGSTLRLNGEPYTLTGVLPASFEFPLGPEPVEAWILFTPEPVEPRAGMALAFRPIGRLAPGVDLDRAEDQVTRLVRDFRASVSGVTSRTVVRPLKEDFVGAVRTPLLLLTLAGGLVLVVASLNLSLLIAARNVERRGELNVRVALGATRGRILRHLLTEAGILAAVGGGLAVAAAAVVLGRVFESHPGGLTRTAGAEIGAGVVLVGLLAAAVPALVAAALPAARLAAEVRALGSRGSSSDRRGQRFARVLSGVEAGLVFALLVVAALVLRSLREVTAVDPGFEASSTVALTVFLPSDEYAWENREATSRFLLAVEEHLEGLPGVRAAGTISNLPLSPGSWSGTLEIEGREEVGVDGEVVVDWELVGPGYFDAIGIPVLRGRGFDERDRADASQVVVVNETLARRWWPEGNAIGARISGGGPLRTVVGIVGDVKQQGLHAGTRGFMYVSALQTGAPPRQEVVVRAEGDDPTAVIGQVRASLLEIEPDLAVGSVRTLDTLVTSSAGSFRLRAVLLSAFAAMALLLGMAGIYGVTAHGVRSRRRDIGIRMAMGADGDRIMTTVLIQALLPVVVGLVGGLVAVVLLAPALRGLLFGVTPTDPASVLGIAALLLASGAAAVLPSALRARGTDPVGMLRVE